MMKINNFAISGLGWSMLFLAYPLLFIFRGKGGHVLNRIIYRLLYWSQGYCIFKCHSCGCWVRWFYSFCPSCGKDVTETLEKEVQRMLQREFEETSEQQAETKIGN